MSCWRFPSVWCPLAVVPLAVCDSLAWRGCNIAAPPASCNRLGGRWRRKRFRLRALHPRVKVASDTPREAMEGRRVAKLTLHKRGLLPLTI